MMNWLRDKLSDKIQNYGNETGLTVFSPYLDAIRSNRKDRVSWLIEISFPLDGLSLLLLAKRGMLKSFLQLNKCNLLPNLKNLLFSNKFSDHDTLLSSVRKLCFNSHQLEYYSDVSFKPTHLPIVIWHGMGDWCCSQGMNKVMDFITSEFPGTYVYSLKIGDSQSSQTKAGYFGNVNEQVEDACIQIKQDPKLTNGFNAIGFSQGGQFLRALVQRCEGIDVHNLVTFGSQHAGVSDIPNCPPSENGFFCKLMRSAVSKGVYVKGIRDGVVQAQVISFNS
jgi:hypothetical protein